MVETTMQSNLHYFEDSIKNKEQLIDLDYHGFVNHVVIPTKSTEKNDLTDANDKIIVNIDTIETLIESGCTLTDPLVQKSVKKIDKLLDVENINYSAFCQYFNVHNINHSIFVKLAPKERIEILNIIIEQYIKDRNDLYHVHKYSNVVLQAFSDNYSHKRKGEYGTNKIKKTMAAYGIPNLLSLDDKEIENNNLFYLLSDKGGKAIFKKFVEDNNIRLSKKGKKTIKYPDAFIRIGNDFFVVEQKNLKENGGGQDKQALEVANFIDKRPELDGLHYIGFIDGIYFNQINKKATGKVLKLYKDIRRSLKKHCENYFVNTFGFNEVIKDYVESMNGGQE